LFGGGRYLAVVLLPLVSLLGLVIGSFLTTVVHRVPRGKSVIAPRSHCQICGTPVRHRHNIPVVGWLVLKGRCACCRVPIPVRYPLVELGTAVVFAALTARLTDEGLLSALPAYLYFAALGIALVLIDLDFRQLPDVLVLPAYPILGALLTISAAVRLDWWSPIRAVAGATVLFALFLTAALVFPGGTGVGEVKLAGVVGAMLAFLSWPTLVVGVFSGFVLGSLTGLTRIVLGRARRGTAIPLGPFMIAGGLLAIFVTEPVAAYLR
jgi:leader peptidase (prepilin peptidase)/N-methyltransferase